MLEISLFFYQLYYTLELIIIASATTYLFHLFNYPALKCASNQCVLKNLWLDPECVYLK